MFSTPTRVWDGLDRVGLIQEEVGFDRVLVRVARAASPTRGGNALVGMTATSTKEEASSCSE